MTDERDLFVDPGPAGGVDLDEERPADDGVQPQPTEAEQQGWEAAAVETLVDVAGLILHWTLARDVEDAFMPDERERRTIAAPATRLLNRWEWTRRLGKWGDLIAFTGATGTFLKNETREVQRARAGWRPPVEQEAPPESFGVIPVTEPDTGSEGPQVRAWRPQVVPQ